MDEALKTAPPKFTELSLITLAQHRVSKAPPKSTVDRKGLLRNVLIQMGKAVESGTIEDYAKLFQLLTFAFVDPALDPEQIGTVAGYYNQAWHSYNPQMAKSGYLQGMTFAIGNGNFLFALPQLAMMVAQNGIKRADFELELQKLDFGEEAISGPQNDDRPSQDKSIMDV